MTDQEMLKEIYEGMHKLQNVVESVENRVINVESRVTSVENEVKSSREDINNIQLTLENVTNKNINIIAEGHSDLSRKLDEAVKINSEKELLLIRVNLLESDVRKLKEAVEKIA